jgi:hypothetical protein
MSSRSCYILSSLVQNLNLDILPEDTILPLLWQNISNVAGLPNVSPLVRFVSSSERIELELKARKLASEFAHRACQGALLDGIDFPETCRDDVDLRYFRDLLFADALAQSLSKSGFERIVYVGDNNPPVHQPLHAVFATLRFYFGKRLTYLSPSSQWIEKLGAWMHAKLSSVSGRIQRIVVSDRPLISKSQIISIFATSEWERFTQPLLEMQKAYGSQYQFWYLGQAGDRLLEWIQSTQVQLVNIPYPEKIDQDIRSFFSSHWENWMFQERHKIAQTFDCPSIASDYLIPHFNQRFNYTMAHAAQWARTLASCMQKSSPELMVGSSACTYMTGFPYQVARNLSVRTIALPVTYVPHQSPASAPSEYFFCHNRFQRENHAYFFPNEKGIRYCGNASNTLSYIPSGKFPLPNEPIVALLSARPADQDGAMPLVDTSRFLETWKELAMPPFELAGLNLVVKSHPRYDLAPILRNTIVDKSPNFHVLPGNAPLLELLGRTWVTVIVDHYGSVVTEAIIANKPVIFLETADYFVPKLDRIAWQAGEVISSVAELWHVLRRLQNELNYYEELLERNHQFCKMYFQTAECSVVDELKKLN